MAASVVTSNHLQVQMPGPDGKHSAPTAVPAAETSTHLESASASHRGAAANLLDQSELHGGFRYNGIPHAGADALFSLPWLPGGGGCAPAVEACCCSGAGTAIVLRLNSACDDCHHHDLICVAQFDDV